MNPNPLVPAKASKKFGQVGRHDGKVICPGLDNDSDSVQEPVKGIKTGFIQPQLISVFLINFLIPVD